MLVLSCDDINGPLTGHDGLLIVSAMDKLSLLHYCCLLLEQASSPISVIIVHDDSQLPEVGYSLAMTLSLLSTPNSIPSVHPIAGNPAASLTYCRP